MRTATTHSPPSTRVPALALCVLLASCGGDVDDDAMYGLLPGVVVSETDDPFMPVVATHEGGDAFALLTQPGGAVTAAAYVAADGDALVVWAGRDGAPSRLQTENVVALFDNHDGATVDVGVVRADGETAIRRGQAMPQGAALGDARAVATAANRGGQARYGALLVHGAAHAVRNALAELDLESVASAVAQAREAELLHALAEATDPLVSSPGPAASLSLSLAVLRIARAGLGEADATSTDADATVRQMRGVLRGEVGAPRGQIAFVSLRGWGSNIYVVPAAGGDAQMAPLPWGGDREPMRMESPTWAPDTLRLAYTALGDGRAIMVSDVLGRRTVNLTRHDAADADPSWSTRGDRIAFASSRDGHSEIYVMYANGAGRRSVTRSPGTDAQPSWSPDDTRIAFVSRRDRALGREVFVMGADGSDPTALTRHPADDSEPAWSPGGSRIAFVSRRDGASEVYVMDADGGNQRNLSRNDAVDRSPTWSPSGNYIAFMSNRDGNSEVYVMDADGGNPHNITRHPAADFHPSWSRQ